MNLEVLDPRYDREPSYWPELRRQAGLRADWSWDVLAVQAWLAQMPLLISVLRDGRRPVGVVCAGWVSVPGRRGRFVGPGRRRWAGLLHVRAPGTGSVPGWWVADEVPLRQLLRDYLHGMRRELGLACRGALLRQLGPDDLAALPGRLRVVRATEANGVLPTAGFGSREEWLASLARKRRQDLRKIFARIEADDSVEVTVGSGSGLDPVTVATVLRHNERKYRSWLSPPPEPTGYLAALLRQPDVATVSYTDRASGALIGLLTILDDPSWPVARNWSAVPVEQGGRAQLYFHWYGLAVRRAVTSGQQGIILGRGKSELKRTLGAELVPQYAAAVPVW